MSSSVQYCLIYTNLCFTVTEWKDLTLALAAVIAVPSAIFTAYKTYQELSRRGDEIKKEQELKSIEFTLEQHRRLFDDTELYSVLCLIDNDDPKLAEQNFWDSKRKLLVFFEEIQLLINSRQINKNVAHYLFGYYAISARKGKNFCEGIDLQESYFGLFFIFKRESEKFLEDCKKNPKLIQDLNFSIDQP